MAAYTKQFLVAYPECDINNHMRLSGIMRQIQQIGGEHLDHLGLTYKRMEDDGFVLLLAKEGLTIRRIPAAGEHITLETTPRRPKGANLFRDCTFYDESGRELIFAETTWVAANPADHRIVRPKELPYDFVESLEEKDYAVTGQRVRLPGEAKSVGKRRIVFSDIDCNRHLNNAVYGDIVYDFLPFEVAQGRALSTFFIHFQREAVLGEEIDIFYAQPDSDTCILSGLKDGGEACFTAQLTFA
ncbi:acyl-[acyl-carrier-protein] thioesterase [Acetanaerobacterium elongatum]|uniref:Acyl-ACP thioesterase n=1 Tax=Acetanaerobacterium elongatum TaxID=258515 RepID=A0A1H0DF87_9FIRM|nr:acyl-ACP thioesterase domain-containing protein [Acetanaerobacterium elongatum]SDN68835.1 Acyl-ACP thioesterase [Acetanaerobacterium elongatum]